MVSSHEKFCLFVVMHVGDTGIINASLPNNDSWPQIKVLVDDVEQL